MPKSYKKHADEMNTKPIWDYAKNTNKPTTQKRSLQRKDGAMTSDQQQIMQGWAEYITKNPQLKPEALELSIERMPEKHGIDQTIRK